MVNIDIVRVTETDIDQLQMISKLTFSETFSAVNTEVNMNKYLEESFSIEKLKLELSDNYAEFYFAKLEEKVIGYLKLNFGQSQTEIQLINTFLN